MAAITNAQTTASKLTTASPDMDYSMESIKAYLANYTVWLPELVIYAGIGFFLGFLLRNFGRIMISVVAIVLITLIVLQYTGMMVTSLPDMLGLSGISSVQELMDIVLIWIKTHIMGTIGFLLGLSLGFKLG
jgi:uncharacterized membrane protein (Fun14 family)